MDFSRFKLPHWLIIGGAAGFLIFGTFLDWAKVEAFGQEFSGNNAFDYFFRGVIPWLLVVGSGVVTFLLANGTIKRSGVPWPLVLFAATALSTLLVLLLILTGPDDGGADLDPAAGLWLSFISAIVALVGSVLYFRMSGGDFKDLTDMDKLKGQFGRGGTSTTSTPAASAPPPPPPPSAGGMSPPPPPSV